MKRFAILTVCLAFASTVSFAQKVGDVIYGNVSDSKGPLAGVSISEINKEGRTMVETKTDEKGNYSFRLVNGWNREKAVRNSPVWGKFKNIMYY